MAQFLPSRYNLVASRRNRGTNFRVISISSRYRNLVEATGAAMAITMLDITFNLLSRLPLESIGAYPGTDRKG